MKPSKLCSLRRLLLGVILALLVGSGLSTAKAAQTCERLASIRLADATITLAQQVRPGAFRLPGAEAAKPSSTSGIAFRRVPAFCRVAATLRPSVDSEISIEVWMPSEGWNGKFEAVGNGGFAGSIPFNEIADAVDAGYAAAGTDTGHIGNNGDFALGHPEKLIDFGYRSIHEMTVQAKIIMNAYYGTEPRFSYFNGCSTGGRQALVEAQRYPRDFNGIIAGAASWNQLRLHAARIALNLMVNQDSDSVIPPSKYPMIHDAVLRACDALDGVKDGVIEDPLACHFDYASLMCHGADSPDCLTKGQVASAKAMTTPIKDPNTGTLLYPGHFWPGSELGWGLIGGPQPSGEAVSAMKNIVIKNPEWNYHTLQMSRDVVRATKLDQGSMYSGNPNILPFVDSGGKLLLYHGWSDPIITPQNSIIYYNDVVKAIGKKKATNSIELFMIPGMNHCDGGPGTDNFDKLAVIDQWVETGKPPSLIIASHQNDGKTVRTRPLCPYPEIAEYGGSGSTDDAWNFRCKMH